MANYQNIFRSTKNNNYYTSLSTLYYSSSSSSYDSNSKAMFETRTITPPYPVNLSSSHPMNSSPSLGHKNNSILSFLPNRRRRWLLCLLNVCCVSSVSLFVMTIITSCHAAYGQEADMASGASLSSASSSSSSSSNGLSNIVSSSSPSSSMSSLLLDSITIPLSNILSPSYVTARGAPNKPVPTSSSPPLPTPQSLMEDAITEVNRPFHSCTAGATYSIKSTDDLHQHLDQLECVFSAGLAPVRPPIGLYYGGILKALGATSGNFVLHGLWQGKIGLQTQCQDSDTQFYILMNLYANNIDFPAYLYVGTLREKLHPEEYDDGKESLFVDYTVDFSNVCPASENLPRDVNMSMFNAKPPASHIVDLARVVGKTSDGGHIMLGKAYIRNPSGQSDTRMVIWWYVVNYDSAAYPVVPDPIGPLTKDFTYRNWDVVSFFTNMATGQFFGAPSLYVEKLLSDLSHQPFAPEMKTKITANEFHTAGIPTDPRLIPAGTREEEEGTAKNKINKSNNLR
eukprot:GHVQ01026132.1.p1 GENE.GHVQ01026132.1~~GHVQ01026132.1.p1  ORF type:complete len:511 (+),score=80.83 GHVQ01026132.1:270-1802(+)